jgi:RNA polymerase sigma factor (sigma-70 family)
MRQQASHEDRERSSSRRLLAVLAARARNLGSRDAESAVQETLKRSLQKPAVRAAIDFYFGEDHADDAVPPEWPLDQLFAWLHGVLKYVVLDESSRASRWREVPMPDGGRPIEPVDPAPDPLAQLMDREIRGIVAEALPKLGRDYRTVLKMRANGMKYSDISDRLGVSENTVATWVSRGIRELGQQIRRSVGK